MPSGHIFWDASANGCIGYFISGDPVMSVGQYWGMGAYLDFVMVIVILQ